MATNTISLIRKLFFLFSFTFCILNASQSQEKGKNNSKIKPVIADTAAKTPRYRFDSTLFADSNTLTKADYLLALQKAFATQNNVPVVTESFSMLGEIENALTEDDSVIALIKERLAGLGNRTINLQNIQTYQELLTTLQSNNSEYDKTLFNYDSTLDNLKKSILSLRKDTVLRKVFRDSIIRASLLTQIKDLRSKRMITDSLVRLNTENINNLKARVSANTIAITELLFRLKNLSRKATDSLFVKDRRYLWQPSAMRNGNNNFKAQFQRRIETEKKITRYYFKNTKNNRLYVLVILAVFFAWVYYNFHTALKRKKEYLLSTYKFTYIKPVPVVASLLFALTLAPLFDINAPAIYSEFIEIVTLIALSVYFFKKLPRITLFYWFGFCFLFLTLPALRLLGLPISTERWAMFFIDTVSAIFGVFVFIQLRKKNSPYKQIVWAIILYSIFNLLSVVCNLFGRVVLSNIFHFTAHYTLAQVIALTIWAKIVVEVILLQIVSSRIRKNYPEEFDVATIQKGLFKITAIIATIICFILFTDNLNTLNIVIASFSSFLAKNHNIGSFSFTLGGIFLFLGIIAIANFLQKYIGHFFGDTGDDFLVENKKERSRLLITRLILLIAGFLLAVAASGLPVDRITIILGALSVGIGLGLQNIVSNFVSGVILIFDRTLRIGDIVEISDKKGRVKEIGLRASKLLSSDGAEIIIPNGDVLSRNIINWTLTNNHVRLSITFTIGKPYDADEVSRICNEEILKNNNVVKDKKPSIVITGITSNFSTLKIYFWCNNIAQTESTYSQLYEAMYNSLELNGIKLL